MQEDGGVNIRLSGLPKMFEEIEEAGDELLRNILPEDTPTVCFLLVSCTASTVPVFAGMGRANFYSIEGGGVVLVSPGRACS